ncbi:MAG: AAA family ATPase [Thermosynechococcaceae cyanobacterium]
MTEAKQEIRVTEQGKFLKDYSPAYFLSIELENVLCFKTRQKLNLSNEDGFPAQWTVILGDNGVGKTTLLRSLAQMDLGPWSFPQNLSNSHDWNWNRMEDLGLQNTEISAKFRYGFPLQWFPEFAPSKSVEKVLQQKESIFSRRILKESSGLCTYAFDEPDLFGLLVCYGYGANRKMGETSFSEVLHSERCASLFSDHTVLINAEEWLLQADYAVARSAPDNTEQLKQRFDIILNTLKQLLPDISDIQIVPADDSKPRPAAEFLTPYGWVPLQSLSLGYKTVIAWTVDLAARLIDRYPQSPDPLAEPAVVLVDEIDLHLHPKWQRTIMSFLTERFPNTQFIVTAHSPLVVQAAKNANIVLLRREGDHVVIDNNPEVIDNWRVEQVLSSVFELPSPHAPDLAPLMERRRTLLSKSKLTAKDERELKKLEAQIGTIPTGESPEDIRAMDIIRKAAKILENR